jgi:hypothetical protein
MNVPGGRAIFVGAGVGDLAAGVALSRTGWDKLGAARIRSRSAGRIYQAPVPLARAAARLAGLLPARLTIRALDPVLGWQPPTGSDRR